MQKDNNRENNPQENEKANLLFEQLKNVIDHYQLMRKCYAEVEKDLSVALNEIERLKKQLQSKPVAKFHFNVN